MAYTTIDDPSAYFQTDLYTGDGSTTQAQTFDGNSDMQPNMVWIKERSEARSHVLFDSVRGVTVQLNVNDTASDATVSDSLKVFGSDGYSVGPNNSTGKGSQTYVAWAWKESATAGFDIVSFTGSGSQRTVAHNLGVKPSMIWVKNRDETENWIVYDKFNTADNFMALNLNSATAASSSMFNVEPTTSVFTVNSSNASNKSSSAMIAYCFADVKGYSKVGTYTGNGNADGSFIHTGFKPAWVMTKRTDATQNWEIYDSKRSPLNDGNNERLRANLSNAEDSQNGCDFFSSGFKWRDSNDSKNTSGATYVYLAFAEQPFVTSTGVPTTAK